MEEERFEGKGELLSLDEISGIKGRATAVFQDGNLDVWAGDDLGTVYFAQTSKGVREFAKINQLVSATGNEIIINSIAAGKVGDRGDVIYVATNLGLQYSVDGGKTFSPATLDVRDESYSALQVSIAVLGYVVLSTKHHAADGDFWNVYVGSLDVQSSAGVFHYRGANIINDVKYATLKFDVRDFKSDPTAASIALAVGDTLQTVYLNEPGGASPFSIDADFKSKHPGHVVNVTSDIKGNIYALWLTEPESSASDAAAWILGGSYSDTAAGLSPVTVLPGSSADGWPSLRNPNLNIFFTDRQNYAHLYMGNESSRNLYWIQPQSPTRREFAIAKHNVLPDPVASSYHDISNAFAAYYALFGSDKKVVRVEVG